MNSETGNVVFRRRNSQIRWYVCLMLPWKTGSQFSNSQSLRRHLSSLSGWTFSRSFIFVHLCSPLLSRRTIAAMNRNLFKQAAELTPSSLSVRWKLQFPAWNSPEIISLRDVSRGPECTWNDKVSRRYATSVQLLNCQSQFEVRRVRSDPLLPAYTPSPQP